jgi:hypothetical protein
LTAPRQYLDSPGERLRQRIELVPLSYKNDSDGKPVAVAPHINIWAGNQQFCLDRFNLTQPEQEWLACELSQWLGLPILRKQKVKLRRKRKESRKFPPLSNIHTSSNKLEP